MGPLNGKVERSHRIDQEEFYRMPQGVVIDDTGLFNTRLKEDDTGLFNTRLNEWGDFCNFYRPHGALGGPDPV